MRGDKYYINNRITVISNNKRADRDEGLEAVGDHHAEHLHPEGAGEARQGVHAVGEQEEHRRRPAHHRRPQLPQAAEARVGGGAGGVGGCGGWLRVVVARAEAGLALGEGRLGGVAAGGGAELPDHERGGGGGGDADGGLEQVDERGGAGGLGEGVAGFADDDGHPEPNQRCRVLS